MRRPRLLLATPDPELRRQLGYYATQLGAELLHGPSTVEALRQLETHLPDVLVLDSGPTLDGAALCRKLRGLATFLDLPILFLADRTEARYQAFQAGATDVMAKPVDPLEFQYRLRVHLKARVRRLETAEAVQAGTLQLEPATHTARVGERHISLTPSEFAILSYLAARPATSVGTEELLVDALGEARALGNPQVVHTHIRNLRRKLEADPARPTLVTSSRRGYAFHAPDS